MVCQTSLTQKANIWWNVQKYELDAAKSVNQLCEEMRIPHKNPGISAMPNKDRQAKEKTSKYLGVHWYKQRTKWCARLHLYKKQHFGGLFKNEVDAARKVNQLCEEMGIPHKNHGISAIPNQQWKHENNESESANVVFSSEIISQAKDDNDSANDNKRKREKDLMNDNFSIEQYYFYDKFLK